MREDRLKEIGSITRDAVVTTGIVSSDEFNETLASGKRTSYTSRWRKKLSTKFASIFMTVLHASNLQFFLPFLPNYWGSNLIPLSLKRVFYKSSSYCNKKFIPHKICSINILKTCHDYLLVIKNYFNRIYSPWNS